MSFQKAHQISNELAEVVITTAPVATSGWGTTPQVFNPVPTVAGRAFRVLEIGYIVTVAGTNDGSAGQGLDACDVGVSGDGNAYIDALNIPATPAVKFEVSTSRGGAQTLSYVAAGSGNVDSDGVPFLNAGDVPVVQPTASVTNGPSLFFYMRLAPVAGKDVFA